MKYLLTIFLFTIVFEVGNSQELKTQTDSLSYSLGIIVGKNLQLQGVENISYDAFISAFNAMINGGETILKPSDAETYFSNYQIKKQEMLSETNKAEGQVFLTENGKREGVVTTESGLQYEILTQGEGPKPGVTDKVLTHYHGTLLDGTVFDSSVDRGEPIEFPLNRVIKGWTEVLQIMPVGSKYRTYIPYNLAYGERGAGGTIPPYATLIFDIELLEIK